MSALPTTLAFDPKEIPADLACRPQWVGWRWRQAGGKWTKQPVNPASGTLASHADSDTWGTIEAAIAAVERYGLAGIGYVFAADDPYAGVDLDDCVDPASRVIAPWAGAIVEEAASYSEFSPSGTGIKIIVRGAMPAGRGHKKPEIEMYDRLRFFTITGQRVPGTTRRIMERTEFITELCAQWFPPVVATVTPIRPAVSLADAEVIERATTAKNGHKFRDLFDGNTAGYGSASEADAALCSMIAFWVGPDHGRIDRIFRQSKLYRPKWEREDYRNSTMTLACDRADYYEAPSTNYPTIMFDQPDAAPAPSYVVELADGLLEPREPDAWLVEGLFRQQAVQLIVGPPKTFKSFFAQELSISVGTGTSFLAMFPSGDPRRVLYVQEESARQHLWNRYEQILLGRAMHRETVRGQVFVITNQGVRLDDALGLQKLLTDGIEAVRPDLVIFDPLREMHWQDENKAETMLPILRAFKDMRDHYGVTVAIVHHNNKNPLYSSPADSIRGSSAIWGAMDGGVFVSTTDQETVMKVQVVLKEGGQTQPFLYSFKEGGQGVQFDVVTIDDAKRGMSDEQIIAAVSSSWATLEELSQLVGLSVRSLRPRLNAIAGRGLIEKRAEGSASKAHYRKLVVNDAPSF